MFGSFLEKCKNMRWWKRERLHTCTKIPHSYPLKPSWNPLVQSNCNEWRLPFIFSDRILYEITWNWKLRREYGASGGDVIRSSIRKDILFSNTAHRSSQNNCMKRFQQTQSPSLPPWWNGLYVTALSVYPPSQRIWKGKGKKNVGDVRFSAVKQRVCPYLCRCTCRAAASWGEDRRRRRSG